MVAGEASVGVGGQPAGDPVEEPARGAPQRVRLAGQRLRPHAAPSDGLARRSRLRPDDAEIDCLVFDPADFAERASELRAQFPDLILLGFGPNNAGDDYLALAETFEPGPLTAPDVHLDDLCTVVYTGGTTGRPKGVLMSHRVWQAMTWIQMSEWEFPDEIRIALPRRCRTLRYRWSHRCSCRAARST